MSLNIKDPEAHELAQIIARRTGESMTRVVVGALREKLERLPAGKNSPEALAADLRAIVRKMAPHIRKPAVDHAELLYDEYGLPK